MLSKLIAACALMALCCDCACFLEPNGAITDCENVQFRDVVDAFVNIKDKIQSSTSKNCRLPKLGSDQVVFNNVPLLELSCDIQELVVEAFSSLEKLNLHGNQVIKIPNDVYQKFDNLKKLDYTRMRNPTEDSLYRLANLTELRKSSEKLSKVGIEGLKVLPKLEQLYLNNNGVFVILLGSVSEVGSVERAQSKLELFNRNKVLNKLKLRTDVLNTLPLGLYNEDKDLVYLDLAYCKLEKFDSGIFAAVPKLKTLILSGNPASKLPANLFEDLKSLERVDLSFLRLTDVPRGLFDRSVELRHVDLSRNSLVNIWDDLFRNNPSLVHFNVSHNGLLDLPARMLAYLTLDVLDVSHNRLEDLDLTLIIKAGITDLHVRGNHLSTLEPPKFALPDSSLKYLDLRDNRLVYLKDNFFTNLPNLESMEFTGNPWECKCLDRLLILLNRRNIGYTKNGYFDGQHSVCVAYNSISCNVQTKDLRMYYDIMKFNPQLDTRIM